MVRKSNGTPVPPEPVLSIKEQLAMKAKAKSTATAAKKSDRPVIELTYDDHETKLYAEQVDRFTAADAAKKGIDGLIKTAQAALKPYLITRVMQMWVDQGRKMDNPRVQTPGGSSFNFQVKDTLTGARGFKVPKDENGQPVPIEKHLAAHGVSKDLISNLKDSGEFKEQQVLGFVDMTKLETDQPVLAERLMALVLAANQGGVTTSKGEKIKFNDNELELILEQSNNITVKEGFLDRSVTYCKDVTDDPEVAVTMLQNLLTAVPPQWAFGQANCLHPETAIAKLLSPETDGKVAPPPPAPPVEHDTGKFILRVTGTLITIVRRKDGKEVAKKQCKDDMHCKNSIRKFMENPASLDTYVADNMG